MGLVSSRTPQRFWVEITAVLTAKVLALTALYLVCFSTPAQAPDIAGHLFHVGSGK